MLGGNFATAFLNRGAVSAWVAEAFAHSRSECLCYFPVSRVVVSVDAVMSVRSPDLRNLPSPRAEPKMPVSKRSPLVLRPNLKGAIRFVMVLSAATWEGLRRWCW